MYPKNIKKKSTIYYNNNDETRDLKFLTLAGRTRRGCARAFKTHRVKIAFGPLRLLGFRNRTQDDGYPEIGKKTLRFAPILCGLRFFAVV